MKPNDLLWIWRPWVTPLVVILLCYFGYKTVRQVQANAVLYSSGQKGLNQLISSTVQIKYAIPFVAFLGLIVPDMLKNGPELALMPLFGAAIAAASFGAAWRYERHERSVRAILCMLDVGLLTVGTALPLAIVNLARNFAKDYALYRDHLYFYIVVVLATGLGVLLAPAKVPARIRQQIATLGSYVETGITPHELYDALTIPKGAKEAIENWGPQRFAAIMAPIAVTFVIAGALGGGDYILYFCFLLALPIAGFLLPLAIVRRAYILKYLGTQDILISDTWNPR